MSAKIEDREVTVRCTRIYDHKGNKKVWKEWQEKIDRLNKDGFLDEYLEYCREYN